MERKSVVQQLVTAFGRSPGPDGVIHGLRKIKLGKYGSRSSLFYSAKNRCLIPVESRLEREFCYVLEVDRTVRAYRTQCLQLQYLNGEIYPDFQVMSTQNTFKVIEVKTKEFADAYANRLRTQFIERILAAEGIPYLIATQLDCRARTDFDFISMLYERGGKHLSSSNYALKVLVSIVSSAPLGRITVADARAKLIANELDIRAVEAAVFHGHLLVADRRAFAPSSQLEVVQ